MRPRGTPRSCMEIQSYDTPGAMLECSGIAAKLMSDSVPWLRERGARSAGVSSEITRSRVVVKEIGSKEHLGGGALWSEGTVLTGKPAACRMSSAEPANRGVGVL